MCLGLASGYVPPKKLPTYEVKDVVCDYGVFENGELMDGLILNSRANALLIADILTADVRHVIHDQAANAEWVHIPNTNLVKCSHCGSQHAFLVNPHFCQNCGAKMRETKEVGVKKIKFILNGCDISFIAEAPENITLKQLPKQSDRIYPDWCACGICTAEKEDCQNLPTEIVFDYDDVKKANDDVSCRIKSITDGAGK